MKNKNELKQLSFDYSFKVLDSAKTLGSNIFSLQSRIQEKEQKVDQDLYRRIISRAKHL